MKRTKKQIFQTKKYELYCFADSLSICKQLLEGGVRVIQFRHKHLDDEAFYRLSLDMLNLTKNYDDGIFIINDRVDIAIDIHADGIHVGQEDEDYRQVIQRVPDHMIVGVSVDTVQEAIDAQQAGADYVGAGAAFPTPTKSDAKVIGLDTIREIVKSIHIPTVAIGGISLENIHDVMTTGAQYYAIISQINNAPDIPIRIKQFYQILKKNSI